MNKKMNIQNNSFSIFMCPLRKGELCNIYNNEVVLAVIESIYLELQ
jgi:hypothetical protein